MLEKKELHMTEKIAAELRKAKANAVTNKRGERGPVSLSVPKRGKEGRSVSTERKELTWGYYSYL